MTLDEDDLAVIVMDLFLCLLIVFMVQANPPPKAAQANTASPGSIIIELSWDQSVDADIDQWVQEPGGIPVGYRNKVYFSCALLRDDLGHTHTDDSHNYEMTVCSGIHAGEYIVNAMFFSSGDSHYPVNIETKVTVVNSQGPTLIADVRDKMAEVGQELTMVRFTLDKDGNLVGPTNRAQHYLALQR